MLLLQKLFDAPCMPCYSGEQGGLVLDRVLWDFGRSNHWWGSLTGRLRAQRLWTGHQDGTSRVITLKDPGNYALYGRTHAKLGPIKAQAVLDVGTVDQLKELVRGRWPRARPGGQGASARVSAVAGFRTHEASAVATWNEPLLDSASAYYSAPRTFALDVRSKPRPNGRGLLYRLGAYRVEAPLAAAGPASPPDLRLSEDGAGAGLASGAGDASVRASTSALAPQTLRRSTYLQAGVLWERSRYLWRAAKPPGRQQGPGSNQPGWNVSLSRLSSTISNSGLSGLFPIVSRGEEGGATHQDSPPGTRPAAAPPAGPSGASSGPDKPQPPPVASAVDGKTGTGIMAFERPVGPGRGPDGPHRRPSISLFIDRPHVSVAGALGAVVKVPLEGIVAPGEAAGAGGAAPLSLPLRTLSQAVLRPFASALVSAQLGSFSRAFLDYTQVSARMDIGLTAPSTTLNTLRESEESGDGDYFATNNRAFALEGRGVTHAVTMSGCQQVFGPLRARVDLRFGVDPIASPAGRSARGGFGWALGSVAQHVQGLRPTLLDCVYGADLVIPNTGGGAKVTAWFSPMRREAMAELRLLG